MTTEQLAAETGVPRDVILEMLDAGWFHRTVTIKDGRPLFSRDASQIVQKARALADHTAAGTVTPTQAWLQLQELKRQ
jgi:hypothetical protein